MHLAASNESFIKNSSKTHKNTCKFQQFCSLMIWNFVDKELSIAGVTYLFAKKNYLLKSPLYHGMIFQRKHIIQPVVNKSLLTA